MESTIAAFAMMLSLAFATMLMWNGLPGKATRSGAPGRRSWKRCRLYIPGVYDV